MNAKTIDAIMAIRNGFDDLLEAIKVEEMVAVKTPTAEPSVEKVPEKTPEKKSTRKVRESAEVLPSEDELTQENLDAMSYNALKKLAKKMGIAATGARDELTEKILSLNAESEDSEETEEVEEVEEDQEFDPNDLNNPNMTEKRKQALIDYDHDMREDFESGALTRKDIVAWLNDYENTKGTRKKTSDEDLLDAYIYAASLMIDDEGEMPSEEGPYLVNTVPYCCGHELKYNEDNDTYICECCGSEYAPEEETEEVEEEKPEKKTSKRTKKVEEPEPEEDEDDETEEDDDEDEEESLASQVEEAVSDMSNEEIMDLLTDVGVKAKGKRQSLIAAVVKAVEDGLIDFSDDEDDEE